MSLKAYLLHVGVSDEWNRIHIGHDLLAALACARHAGLRDAPDSLASLAAELTPFYQRHPVWPKATQSLISSPLAEAYGTAGGLIWTAAEQIGCAGIAAGKEGT
ncbi:hypothetical protein ACO2Q3_00975 [Caulobacter sp. KR2-114]|uniref:hypothetical protein n=1 Tax=Caulobacter sp. KR2-114 TaxID=3400912 RepID=UPI003BFF4AEF